MIRQQEPNHRDVSQSLKFPVSFLHLEITSLVLRLARGTGKHNQAFSTQSHPPGPLFFLLVFIFLSSIRHKLFMAKLPLTMFMRCLVQWHPFSAEASGHSCNTNNHDDNNNNSQLCCAHWAPTASACPTELRSLYFTAGSWSVQRPFFNKPASSFRAREKLPNFAFQVFV